MKILVADDDSLIRDLLTILLENMGHEVVTAASGDEAFERFQNSPTPLVITDRMMPRVDGLELCRRIRGLKLPRYTYIVMLTAAGGKDGFLAGMDAGADDFMTKPFDDEELAARLRVAERVLGLQSDLRMLQGLLPICSYCKRIRDDQQYWAGVEEYMARHSQLRFSHGICPTCWQEHVEPELEGLEGSSAI